MSNYKNLIKVLEEKNMSRYQLAKGQRLHRLTYTTVSAANNHFIQNGVKTLLNI